MSSFYEVEHCIEREVFLKKKRQTSLLDYIQISTANTFVHFNGNFRVCVTELEVLRLMETSFN